MCRVGGGCILLFGKNSGDLMPLFLLISRIGNSSLFNLVYAANAEMFPTLFAGTAMGICNLLARICTIFAPQVAEYPG